MKNIEVNNDDYSFENSITFNKLIEKHHQKTKENIIIGSLIGSIILSSGTIYKVGKDILETKEYNESINCNFCKFPAIKSIIVQNTQKRGLTRRPRFFKYLDYFLLVTTTAAPARAMPANTRPAVAPVAACVSVASLPPAAAFVPPALFVPVLVVPAVDVVVLEESLEAVEEEVSPPGCEEEVSSPATSL